MSLLAWYPLLSSGNNQGLDDVDLTTMGTVTYTNGKLGKAATFTGNAANCLHRAGFKLKDKFTWACWFKMNTDASTSAHHFILSEGRDVGSLGFSLKYHNSVLVLVGYINIATIQTGTWYHVAVTVDSSDKVRAYLNGKLVGSCNYFNPDYAQSSDRFVIGKMAYSYTGTTNYFPLNGQVCDVRIYDEVLSAKEIYEISRGLVLHYPLNSQYECGITNKYSGVNADGSASTNSGFTKTALTTERGYNYKLNYTGTGNNAWNWIKFPKFTFTAGKVYQYSCKIRVNSISNMTIEVRPARSDNDYANGKTISTADGLWHEYSRAATIPSSFTLGSNTVTSNPLLELCTSNMVTSGTVYSIDFDIKDVQVVECDNYVPFIDNDMVSSNITDCSGFGNNGTRVGSIVCSNDTVKYNNSYDFNGTGYIKNSNLGIYLNEFTISFWIKMSSTITSQHFLFGTFDNWTKNGIGYWRDTGNMKYSGIIKSDAESSYGSLPTPILTADTWTFITIVYTGTKCLMYKDGVLNSSVTYGLNGTVYCPVCYVGNSLYNNTASSETDESSMSDFRIYSTALSAEDIKALYNTKFSVDNQGSFYCGELDETIPNILFDVQRSLMDKSFSNGLNKYVQENCQVTLTDNGYRIYRPPNLTTSANGNTMYGGLKLQNPGHWLKKGHTYIILFNIKGQTANYVGGLGWSCSMGWHGDQALVPNPSNVSYSSVPTGVFDETLFYYKFTINDDIYKICKTAYSSFVVGTTYLSYKDFQLSFGYASTGELGTDLYLSDFRMYDITELENSNFNENSILECISVIEGNEKLSIGKYGEIYANNLIEL